MTMGLPPRAVTIVHVRIRQCKGHTETKLTLLVGVEGLREEIIASQDHDDGQVLVDQGQHTVLQLTGHDGLTVEVGNLLDLQGTLKGGGELGTTSEKQQGLLVLEGLGAELLDGLVKFKDLLDLGRDVAQALHDLLASLVLGGTVLAKG
jgi:hypothetical protein